MKILPLLNSINNNTFVEDYLNACGVKNTYDWLNTDASMLQNPFDYPQMVEGVELLYQVILNQGKIAILNDVDVDGCFSATICYFLLTKILNYDKTLIKVFQHSEKQHGLRETNEHILQQIIDFEPKLLIVPDAGSNDMEEAKLLRQKDIQVLVLDHHNIEQENEWAVVINPHKKENLNHNLSGTGVAFKFVDAYCQHCGIDYDLSILYNLVALSIISDVCSFVPLENKAFVDLGFKEIEKGDCLPMIKILYEQINKNKNTPKDWAWGAIPYINSLYRVGTVEEREKFFESMNDERPYSEGLKIIKSCHSKQASTANKLYKKLEAEIEDTHKVMIGYIQPEERAFTGLIANKLLGKFHKPSIVLRKAEPTIWSGSMRSSIPLLDELNKSKLAVCQGHPSAHGILVKKSKLKKLIEWFDNLDLSLEPETVVAAEIPYIFITQDLCFVCSNKINWGASESSGVPQPKFYVEIPVYKDEVSVFKKRTNTIKIVKGGVSFMKFMVSNDKLNDFDLPKFNLKAVVTLGINAYNDTVTPQAIIEEYEIEEIKVNDGWEELF